MNDSLINTCKSPTRIKDKRKGGYIYVPCGHCESCKESYRNAWRSRLEIESSKSVSVLFFTLTYDNENVPYVTFDSDSKIFHSNRRYVDSVNLSDLLDYNGNVIDISTLPKLCINHNSQIYVKNTFPIVCREDIQLFLKRLRRSLEYDAHNLLTSVSQSNRSLRYFICSEYGPNTFRPHYHGLLFLRSKLVAKAIRECYIYSSWKLCCQRNIDCQEVFSNAIGYVSKYVTVDSRLPAILKTPSFSTFTLRSSRPAIGSTLCNYSELLAKISSHSLVTHKTVVSSDGVASDVIRPLPSIVISQFFRPIYREFGYSRDDLLRFFNFYSKFCSDSFLKSHCSVPFTYKYLSSVLPNCIKSVDARLEAATFVPECKLSDIYNYLSYEEIAFGIRQNRAAIIHYLLLHLNDKINLVDYVDARLDCKTVRFSMCYSNFVDSFNSSVDKGHHPFDILTWSYPSLFDDLPSYLPLLTHSEYVSLHLRFFSIGYDLNDFYDKSGLLNKRFKITPYSTTSEYKAYLSDIRDSMIKFDKSRKLAQADALGYNDYSPI